MCPWCTGVTRILAFVEQAEVMEKILTHLGLWPTHTHSPSAGAPVAVFPATGRVAANSYHLNRDQYGGGI
jgi:hypothetical protein